MNIKVLRKRTTTR